MIDYIDDCFDLINFPEQDFVEYQRKNFYNIDDLFCFSNPSKNIKKYKTQNIEEDLKNRYINLKLPYTFWKINIQHMRYELEISLMFVLFYYNKGIPETENKIENCYGNYDWSQENIEYDDKNPIHLEQYKKLFDTFLNYFTNSLVMFCNKMKQIIMEIFTIQNNEIFKRKNIQPKTHIKLNEKIKEELVLFIKNFIDFWTESEFSKLKDLRNDFTHHTSPVQNDFKATYNKELDFVDINFKEIKTTHEIIRIIKHSLLLVEEQTKSFKNLIDDYFLFLNLHQ